MPQAAAREATEEEAVPVRVEDRLTHSIGRKE